MKENLPDNCCILQGDFSQNYSMVTQNCTQGAYFNPAAQATIHTFMAYLKIDGKTSPISICVFSDCLSHHTITVRIFLKHVIDHLKTIFPTLDKIIHFTDGAASQYKNYKNFVILVHGRAVKFVILQNK